MIKKMSVFILLVMSIVLMSSHSSVFGAKIIKTNDNNIVKQDKVKTNIQKPETKTLKKKTTKKVASKVTANSAAININKATEDELVSIKGIGPQKAKAIIDHRVKNGKFKNIDQLKEVKGISDKILEKIKSSITI